MVMRVVAPITLQVPTCLPPPLPPCVLLLGCLWCASQQVSRQTLYLSCGIRNCFGVLLSVWIVLQFFFQHLSRLPYDPDP